MSGLRYFARQEGLSRDVQAFYRVDYSREYTSFPMVSVLRHGAWWELIGLNEMFHLRSLGVSVPEEIQRKYRDCGDEALIHPYWKKALVPSGILQMVAEQPQVAVVEAQLTPRSDDGWAPDDDLDVEFEIITHTSVKGPYATRFVVEHSQVAYAKENEERPSHMGAFIVMIGTSQFTASHAGAKQFAQWVGAPKPSDAHTKMLTYAPPVPEAMYRVTNREVLHRKIEEAKERVASVKKQQEAREAAKRAEEEKRREAAEKARLEEEAKRAEEERKLLLKPARDLDDTSFAARMRAKRKEEEAT